ncbi:MAG TPA: TIM barrel protein [Longimicrobiales bacterium]|nr:TIM barrel protein [Longimicrobiales bacterium]
MKRRDFLNAAAAAGAGGLLVDGWLAPDAVAYEARRAPFALDYAPHFGMFRHLAGDDVLDQLRFMADQGFRALEDNGMRGRPVAEQERIAREMARLDMRMGVFVAHTIHWSEPDLAGGDAARREAFLAEIRSSVEVARRVNATWMTVVPGHVDLRLHADLQTAHVVETLRPAAEILEPHGLVMVLEPLNPRDHPGQFLSRIPQAYQICRAVDSPACRILDDLYHQQITEGNLIPNMDAAWDEIAYFQVGDNPGRKEPTTGEINYRNVFAHIRAKGYRGILGMEHGNARPGPEGERAVIEAYRAVDPPAE